MGHVGYKLLARLVHLLQLGDSLGHRTGNITGFPVRLRADVCVQRALLHMMKPRLKLP